MNSPSLRGKNLIFIEKNVFYSETTLRDEDRGWVPKGKLVEMADFWEVIYTKQIPKPRSVLSNRQGVCLPHTNLFSVFIDPIKLNIENPLAKLRVKLWTGDFVFIF